MFTGDDTGFPSEYRPGGRYDGDASRRGRARPELGVFPLNLGDWSLLSSGYDPRPVFKKGVLPVCWHGSPTQ